MEAIIDDESAWIESSEGPIEAHPEALASAFTIPALTVGRRLCVESPVCSRWAQGQPHIQTLIQSWWGYAPIAPQLTTTMAKAAGGRESALCFSGGADSFHSLLNGANRIDTLLCIQGFDIPLDDGPRWHAAQSSVRAVASALGIASVSARTNLRSHPSFQACIWDRSHGGALAAVGHALSDRIGRMAISASYPRAMPTPWGTHWELDPLWSSSRLVVEHVGAELWRAEKLRAIADNDIVQQHLRVCWANRSPTGNCGTCEKCLRTMLTLADCGRLERFVVFPGQTPREMVASLDRIRALRPPLIPVYQRFLEGASADVAPAIVRLLRRSRSRLGRLAWRVRRLLRMNEAQRSRQ